MGYYTAGEWLSAAGLRVRVLGSLGISRDGVLLEPGDSRQRAMLAVLALQANTVVPRDSIIDAVWGDGRPASSANLVQGIASRLRRILAPRGHERGSGNPLASVGSGYQLRLTDDQLDLLAFRDLAGRAAAARSAGNAETACELLTAALNLWRGEPMPDVDRLRDHPLLTEMRREQATAVLAFAEAAADLGMHERVLPALWTLAGNDPLNEKAHSLLMIALAATGQQAEALRVFDQLRTRLDSELGVRPGPHLASAYLRVLRQQFTVSLRSPLKRRGRRCSQRLPRSWHLLPVLLRTRIENRKSRSYPQ